MTCIVAFKRGGKVWIGGDSASVGGLGLTQSKVAKVFENDGVLFGFTTSWRMGQLLRYSFTPPRLGVGQDLEEFMATTFVDEVRKVLKEKGYAEVKDNVEEGGTFLVVIGGRIFKVDSDFQVNESVHPYDACGCGEDIACGALFVSQFGKVPGDEVVRLALTAAETHSAGVRHPFLVLETA